MVRDTQPTNERIVAMLETISRQLDELQRTQTQMAAELKRTRPTGR